MLTTGVHYALNAAIRTATEPGRGLLPRLMHGRPRVIYTWWCGDTDDTESFEQERGDGTCLLVDEDSPFYALPPGIHPGFNFWQGTPFWLFHGPRCAMVPTDQVLATGVIYPRFNAATADVFAFCSGAYVERDYFCDPRVRLDRKGELMRPEDISDPSQRAQQPDPADWVPLREQQRWLRSSGAVLAAPLPFAPLFSICHGT
jgi:hypothetical protein